MDEFRRNDNVAIDRFVDRNSCGQHSGPERVLSQVVNEFTQRDAWKRPGCVNDRTKVMPEMHRETASLNPGLRPLRLQLSFDDDWTSAQASTRTGRCAIAHLALSRPLLFRPEIGASSLDNF